MPRRSPDVEDVNRVREYAEGARQKELAEQHHQARARRPEGRTVAERNEVRTQLLLGGVLPPEAPEVLRRILHHTLAALTAEHDQGAIRRLLDERRDTTRVTARVSDRCRYALDVLAELRVSLEEPADDAGHLAVAAGLDSSSALVGKGNAKMQRARQAGGATTGRKRADEARARHEIWYEEALYQMSRGVPRRNVASRIAELSLGEGADVGTIRRALKKMFHEKENGAS